MRVVNLAACLVALLGAFLPARAAPFTPGNIVVSETDARLIAEFTPDGVFVQSIPTPYPGGYPVTEYPRDLSIGPNGVLQLYNGTFDPYLSSYNPSSGDWTHRDIPGWSTGNNLSYGGIASIGDNVFLTDQMTYGMGDDWRNGIVRMNTRDGSWQRFLEGTDPIDITLGRDGLLYALDYTWEIRVLDPASMSLLRTVNLNVFEDLRGVTADAAGNLYAVTWLGDILKCDPFGTLSKRLRIGPLNLQDIDISGDGRIAVGERFGHYYLTDTDLTSVTSFPVSRWGTFVAFVPEAPIPEPSTLALLASAIAGLGAAGRRRRPDGR